MSAIHRLESRDGREAAPADFAAAVPAPPRILCLGLNYSEHALEGGRAVPTWPDAFVRGADSVLGPYADLVKPALTTRFDYEAELGIVIGAGGRYIRAGDALDAIAGFVVLNDASCRDWQRAATQWTAGKNFVGTMPIGHDDRGLPIGAQIIGGYLDDNTTIAFAGLVEREFGGFTPPPNL